MDFEVGANGVAAFLRLSRPINAYPLHIASAIHNVQFGCTMTMPSFQQAATFSTALLSTGLAIAAIHAGILNGGHPEADTFAPIQWLEYPADYVLPVMDLYVEDQVPFGFYSPPLCPKDTEHLERAFDHLQYQHMAKKLGVPSTANTKTLVVQLLRTLGNTSSNFFSTTRLESLSATLLSATATRLDLLSASFDVSSTQRLLRIRQRKNISGKKDGYDFGSSPPHWTRLAAAYLCLATIFVLFVDHCHFVLSSPEPPMTPRDSREVQEADFDGGNSRGACNDGLSGISPKQSFKALLDSNLLFDSDIPHTKPGFPDKNSHAWSDDPDLEDDSAPDGFAARFDALQDALPSVHELGNLAGDVTLNLARLVVFGIAIMLCFVVRIVESFITGGRFGRRGIRKDVNLPFERTVTVVEMGRPELVETSRQDDKSSPDGSEIATPTETRATAAGHELETARHEVRRNELIPLSAIPSQLSQHPCSACNRSVIPDTVETFLAPVVDGDRDDGESYQRTLVDKRHRSQRKGKSSDHTGDVITVEGAGAEAMGRTEGAEAVEVTEAVEGAAGAGILEAMGVEAMEGAEGAETVKVMVAVAIVVGDAEGAEAVEGIEAMKAAERAVEEIEAMGRTEGAGAVEGIEAIVTEDAEGDEGAEAVEGIETIADAEGAEAVEWIEAMERADGAETVEAMEDNFSPFSILRDYGYRLERIEAMADAERAEAVKGIEVIVMKDAKGAEAVEGIETTEDAEGAEAVEGIEIMEDAEGAEAVERIEAMADSEAEAAAGPSLEYEHLRVPLPFITRVRGRRGRGRGRGCQPTAADTAVADV